MEFLDQVIERFISLVQAPFTNEVMLWSAIPLVLATLFMTLYFGKYGKEFAASYILHPWRGLF